MRFIETARMCVYFYAEVEFNKIGNGSWGISDFSAFGPENVSDVKYG